MSDIGSLNVKIGLDSTGFQNGVSNLNREIKKVQSEFKLASAQIGKHGSELDKLRNRAKALTKENELQRQKVEALRLAHEKSAQTKGTDAKATQDLEIKLNQAQTRLTYMERDLKTINQEISKQSSAWYQLGQTLEPVGQKMQDVGKSMQELGQNLTKKVTLPLVGIGTASIKVGSDFEAGMSKVQAISGAAGEDLAKLSDVAKEMGSTTKFSAKESAEALQYMALAGWDTTEMASGLPGVLDLAAASGMSLAKASDIVTDTMSAFLMGATEAGLAADIFASTQANANTSVDQLGEAMKYAGASANSAGMDLVQTSAILGIFADSGIKGSMAGTTLNAMLRDLKKSADDGMLAVGDMTLALYNADGSMRDMGSVIKDIETATKDMTTQQRDMALSTLFGEQALRGANIMLATGSERYRELEGAIRGSEGAAGEMAAVMQDNLQGELTKLKSALEGLAIQIFEVLVPHLSKLVDYLQVAVEWFSNLDTGTQESIVKIGALVAAIGPLLIIGGKIVAGAGTLISVFSKVSMAIAAKTAVVGSATAATGGLGTALTLITGPIGIAVAVIAGLTAALVYLWNTNEDAKNKMVAIWEGIKTIIGGAVEIIKGIVKTFIGLLTGDWDLFTKGLEQVWNGVWQAIKGIFDVVVNAIKVAVIAFTTLLSNIWSIFTKSLETLWNFAWDTIKAVFDKISTTIKTLFDSFITRITTGWQVLTEGLKNVWATMWHGIKDIVARAWNLLSGVFTNLYQNIRNWFSSLIEGGISWGKDLMQGFKDGIVNMAMAPVNAVKEVASNISEAVKGFFGIASPSKLFTQYGKFLSEGLARGVEEGSQEAIGAVESVAGKMLDVAKRAVTAISKSFSTTSSGSLASTAKASSSGVRTGNLSAQRKADQDYTQANKSEIERISRKYKVDMSVARSMAKTNDRLKEKKYHDGGWVGNAFKNLRLNEVPAILQKGEFVLSKKMLAGIANLKETMPRQRLVGDQNSHALNTMNIDYQKLAEAMKSGGIHQTVNIYSPKALSPAQTARENKKVLERLALEW